MPLTDRAVKNAKPADKPIRMFDGGGMYLEVAPSGGKWWRLKYRFGGAEKRLSLGVYPDISLAAARDQRDAARKLLAAGTDPGEKRKADKREAEGKSVNSFEAVAREWSGKYSHTWVATHARDVMRRLEANLFPEIGATPIADLTAPALLAAVRKIEERGARDLAHRVLQVSGQVFRYGIATGKCGRDLSADLRGALAPHKAKHQAAVSREELPELLRAIDGATKMEPLTRHALQLAALTFVRTGELIGATWDEINLDSATWVIPAPRMKMKIQHVVPLSEQAVAVFRGIKAMTGTGRFVFPGRSVHKPISNNTMLFALYGLGYKGKMTTHGFRSVASTILHESNFRSDVIERQLAHGEPNEVKAAYNRAEYLPERRQMMQQYADMLTAMIEGAQVVPLKRPARSANRRG